MHEAGHVAVSYLVGCPVTTYTLGELRQVLFFPRPLHVPARILRNTAYSKASVHRRGQKSQLKVVLWMKSLSDLASERQVGETRQNSLVGLEMRAACLGCFNETNEVTRHTLSCFAIVRFCWLWIAIGGLASLQHGEKMGSGPCCSIIDPELSVARESFIDETRLWIGDPSEPLCRESVAREVSFRHAARKNRPWGDSSGWRALAEADRDLALRERREPPSEEGRHAMANRYALSAMGGVVGETLVNGFGLVSSCRCSP